MADKTTIALLGLGLGAAYLLSRAAAEAAEAVAKVPAKVAGTVADAVSSPLGSGTLAPEGPKREAQVSRDRAYLLSQGYRPDPMARGATLLAPDEAGRLVVTLSRVLASEAEDASENTHRNIMAVLYELSARRGVPVLRLLGAEPFGAGWRRGAAPGLVPVVAATHRLPTATTTRRAAAFVSSPKWGPWVSFGEGRAVADLRRRNPELRPDVVSDGWTFFVDSRQRVA